MRREWHPLGRGFLRERPSSLPPKADAAAGVIRGGIGGFSSTSPPWRFGRMDRNAQPICYLCGLRSGRLFQSDSRSVDYGVLARTAAGVRRVPQSTGPCRSGPDDDDPGTDDAAGHCRENSNGGCVSDSNLDRQRSGQTERGRATRHVLLPPGLVGDLNRPTTPFRSPNSPSRRARRRCSCPLARGVN